MNGEFISYEKYLKRFEINPIKIVITEVNRNGQVMILFNQPLKVPEIHGLPGKGRRLQNNTT